MGDHGPAHILKTQKQYAVDGRVFTCTEAKVMVDESQFMEQTIQFQDSIRDAMGMRQILANQPDLKDKLDKVRAAAMELVEGKKDKDMGADGADGAAAEVVPPMRRNRKRKRRKRIRLRRRR